MGKLIVKELHFGRISVFARKGFAALLLLVAMFIISKYELEDNVIDNINEEIESRCKKGE